MPDSYLIFKEPLKKELFDKNYNPEKMIFPIALELDLNVSEVSKLDVSLINLSAEGIKGGARNGRLAELLKENYDAAVFSGVIPFSKVATIVFRNEDERKHFLNISSSYSNVFVPIEKTKIDESYFNGTLGLSITDIESIHYDRHIFHDRKEVKKLDKIRSFLFFMLFPSRVISRSDFVEWSMDKAVFEMLCDSFPVKKKSKALQHQDDPVKLLNLKFEGDKYSLENSLRSRTLVYPADPGPLGTLSLKEILSFLLTCEQEEDPVLAHILAGTNEKNFFNNFVFIKLAEYLIKLNGDLMRDKEKEEIIDMMLKNIKEDIQSYIKDEERVNYVEIDRLKNLYISIFQSLKEAVKNRKKYKDILSEIPQDTDFNVVRSFTIFLNEKDLIPAELDSRLKSLSEAGDPGDVLLKKYVLIFSSLERGFHYLLGKEQKKLDTQIKMVDICLTKVDDKKWPFYLELKKEKPCYGWDDGKGMLLVKSDLYTLPVARIISAFELLQIQISEILKHKDGLQKVKDAVNSLIKNILFLRECYLGDVELLIKAPIEINGKSRIIHDGQSAKVDPLNGQLSFSFSSLPEVKLKSQVMERVKMEIEAGNPQYVYNLIRDLMPLKGTVLKTVKGLMGIEDVRHIN
ncbi:MAG TPA: hypothetical protein PKZ60_00010 [Candidatus Saccharicenans sp.]|nr:hypothetical protein [Candidatus Saccharicenans sp.]